MLPNIGFIVGVYALARMFIVALETDDTAVRVISLATFAIILVLVGLLSLNAFQAELAASEMDSQLEKLKNFTNF